MTNEMEETTEILPQNIEDFEENDGPNVESEQKLEFICQALAEQKARDITILDVRGQTIVSDFFVVCTGTSITHIHSIAEGVRDRLREVAKQRAKPEGDARSYWIIMDYSDVILHVFDEDTREFYDLERLWADAKITKYEDQSAIEFAANAKAADEESSTRNETSSVELADTSATL